MRQGFSILELSMVVVVIGLITGGVMAGRSLVTASEQRAIVQELKAYEQAFGTFVDQYGFPPGDLANATDSWGIAAGTTGNDATCRAAESFTTATCNGNGDGWVGAAWSTNSAPSSSTNYEWFLAWKHLANAGLISGKFSNMVSATSSNALPGYNVPGSDSGNGGYTLVRVSNPAADTYTYGLSYVAHALIFGASYASRATRSPVLTAEQAWHIDQKLDDGLPGTGKLVPTCAAGLTACATDASTYNRASTDPTVALVYVIGQ